MAKKLTFEEFKNFFKYYADEPHQHRAIGLLYDEINKSMFNNQLYTDADWIMTYRNEIESKPVKAGDWPITKEQLGEIMLCDPKSLPDSLMNDLRECYELYDFDECATTGVVVVVTGIRLSHGF